MFCESCGRDYHTYCIHKRKLHGVEVFLILLYLLFIPSISVIALSKINPFFIVSVVLSGVLIVLTFLEFLLKKPYLATFFNCHMRIDRSLKIHKHYFPLCQRCLGIYIGIFLAIPLFYYLEFPNYVYIICSLPMLIDGFIQYHYHIKSNVFRRLSTGLFGGFFLVFVFTYVHIFLIGIVRFIVY